MEAKQLVDFAVGGHKKAIENSGLRGLAVVEPSMGDYLAWQTVIIACGKNPERSSEAYWLAVNAVVRQENGRTKQFLTQNDYQNGKARLHMAIGEAANKFLIDYTAEEDIEKKAE